MRKKIVCLIMVCVIVTSCCIGLSQAVFADNGCGGVETSILSCGDDDSGVYHILRIVLDIFSIGVGILGVIGITLAGVQLMTAGDDAQKAVKSKRRLAEIAIGLVCYILLFGTISWLFPGGAPDIDSMEENSGTIAESQPSSSNSNSTSSSNQNKPSSSNTNNRNNNTATAKKATLSEKNRSNMAKMKKDGKNVTIVGDSITWRTKNWGKNFKKHLKKADIYCERGKRMMNDDRAHGGPAGNGGESGRTILKRLISQGKLREIVVVALGTNDTLSKKDVQTIVNLINSDPKQKHSIYFLTNYKYEKSNKKNKDLYKGNNAIFKEMQNTKKNVMVIDWRGIVSSNPKKYMTDKLHPKTGVGTKLFANTIYRGLTGQ